MDGFFMCRRGHLSPWIFGLPGMELWLYKGSPGDCPNFPSASTSPLCCLPLTSAGLAHLGHGAGLQH